MASIFINYRTADQAEAAAFIERELVRVFGRKEVFRDSMSIAPGDDFERKLVKSVQRAEILLAVIGRNWLTAGQATGERALDSEHDWIRREIVEAFECRVRVIPVLVGDTPRLSAHDLPEALAPLVRCQFVTFDARRADSDIELLIKAIAELAPDLEPPAQQPAERTTGKDDRPSIHTENTGQRGGIGNINGGVGSYYEKPEGPMNTGSGNQHIGTRVSGDGINHVGGDISGGIRQRNDNRPRREGRDEH